jgi:hypothetical protein
LLAVPQHCGDQPRKSWALLWRTAKLIALNEMIDTDAERIAAGRNQIPTGVWVLLIIVAGSGCFTTS